MTGWICRNCAYWTKDKDEWCRLAEKEDMELGDWGYCSQHMREAPEGGTCLMWMQRGSYDNRRT
jgi:hypothetical protein